MRNKKHKEHSVLFGTALCVLSVIIMAFNTLTMYNTVLEQSEQIGSAQLRKVSDDLQHTLDKNRDSLLRFAADIEVYLERGSGLDVLQSYLKSQSSIFRDQSEGTFINAFICTDEWVLISDSPVPDGYIANERSWYPEAVRAGIGNIYVTDPYIDAFTGGMCFSSTLLLPDGKTIIGIDSNLSQIQRTVEQMNREDAGEALIISKNRTIVGCADSGYAGRDLSDVLPEYMTVYNRLLNEKNESLVFDSLVRGQNSRVFCERSGNWMFIYSVGRDSVFRQTSRRISFNFILDIVLTAGILCYCLYVRGYRKKYAPAAGTAESAAAEQSESVARVDADNSSMKDFAHNARNSIMSIMILTIVVAFVFTGIVLVSWGNDRMEREVDSYSYQLEQWMNTQFQTLNMFVDTIAANPSVLDEYDRAVEYLDKIVRNYPEISAAYIARPGNEHEMTMNNGWVPNADYIVAERQWYKDTENSDTGFSVSSPYLDARTGLYCVTFSRIVLDADTREQIGIFALDFYISNLTGIMEASYSDSGYAFLVDNSDLIVNHPYDSYQISSERSTNIAGTVYSNLRYSNTLHFIRDYDGTPRVCIARTEPVTGFSVVAVKDALSIYGIVLLCGGIFIVMLAVCVVLLYRLIVNMMKWQERTRLVLIEEANRASQADRAKSSFLAQMSHEIRTPINAVLGMNEMILRESREESILSYASNAYSAGNALLSIINDVLDISKIEAGKLEITEAEYDLYSLINDCYHMTAGRAEKKGLSFGVTCGEGLPSQLKGDMFHIRQIVVNFITNAIKYTDSGSVGLDISAERENGGFALVFRVSDTGIGLKKESMDKLFSSFQRFDLDRNQWVEGTGLGLSICKQLAELMGGSVKAESEYGKGSVFTCVIPQQVVNDEPLRELRLDRPAERVELDSRETFIAPEARILVVDDVEMNIFVFRNFLKEHQMRIDSASGGKDALKLTAENRYDMIFMDHMMPEMDGIETFGKMKELGHLSEDTTVVMLTANAISGEEEKYLKTGFDAYLTKPIHSEKLEKLLLKYLPEEKVIRQERKPEAKAEKAPSDARGEGASGLFDTATGLMYNGDDPDMYGKVLTMYVDSGAAAAEKLRALAAAESWKDYITEVHALKSTSLMIGSEELSAAAKELELAGKAENYGLIKEKNEGMLELYARVVELGREYLEAHGLLTEKAEEIPDEAELTEISPEKLDELIERIKTACDSFDGTEISDICGEAAKCSLNGRPLAPLFGEVRACADDFEFDDALEKALGITEKLNEN